MEWVLWWRDKGLIWYWRTWQALGCRRGVMYAWRVPYWPSIDLTWDRRERLSPQSIPMAGISFQRGIAQLAVQTQNNWQPGFLVSFEVSLLANTFTSKWFFSWLGFFYTISVTVKKTDSTVSCTYVLKKWLEILANLEPEPAQQVLFGARACMVNRKSAQNELYLVKSPPYKIWLSVCYPWFLQSLEYLLLAQLLSNVSK